MPHLIPQEIHFGRTVNVKGIRIRALRISGRGAGHCGHRWPAYDGVIEIGVVAAGHTSHRGPQ
jgi:hypothetical protein